jgi:DNA-binding transcriptional MerR regulator
LFRQPEVCEIAQVQPYVLRSWEAEFPDLGVAKTEGAPRVYRRADVEFVLRIKHLLFVEGLTLAGARKKLLDQMERPSDGSALQDLDTLFGRDARERILQVKRGLREIATMLARDPSAGPSEASLFDVAPPPKGASKKASVAKAVSKKPGARKKK